MLKSLFSKPYSELYIVGDQANWVIDEEVKSFIKIGEKLGLRTKIVSKMYLNVSQIVHYASQFSLLDQSIYKSRNRISLDYFHGKPEHGESYKKCFEMISRHKKEIACIRVSHQEMRAVMISHGVDESKIKVIPIGINLDMLTPQTETGKQKTRKLFNIPENAFVIGSFQKDGVGWGEGNEPKLIKGPDVFLKTVEKLKNDIPNLHVLLSGPSRGYVKNGLEKLGVPYTHKLLKDYKEVSDLYDALDLYIIASREEGGPKACLESMAKGIPLVTTAVGQCKDLVISGKNAMMTSVENVDELHDLSLKVLGDPVLQKLLVREGLITAKANSYESQLPLWNEYFKKLIS